MSFRYALNWIKTLLISRIYWLKQQGYSKVHLLKTRKLTAKEIYLSAFWKNCDK